MSTIRRSSVVLVTRGRGADLEVFWSRRQPYLPFLGGFWAFVGGSVDEGDERLPLAAAPEPGFPGPEYYGCAARELFEEMGLCVVDDRIVSVADDEELAATRAVESSFADLLRSRGWSVATERFLSIGRWLTPEWFDLRYDSEFFALHLGDAESESIADRLADQLDPGELARGEWIAPAAALAAWRSGTHLISPPIRYLLEALDAAEAIEDVDLHDPDFDFFHHDPWLTTTGIRVVPLRSPTLPPATHTNCVIVGEEAFVVIDPGSPREDQQALLSRLTASMTAEGRRPLAVVLTHHHPDHVGGAAAAAAALGVRVWAHNETRRLLGEEPGWRWGRELVDGDRIELGADSLTVLHTPGHAPGHLCFHHERTGAVIAGDMIASVGTIVVNPPDGHMGEYLASLQRLVDLGSTALYPAHGWIITDPNARLQFYVDHRNRRESKVAAALVAHGGWATPADVVPQAYDDTPRAIWPLAARSAEAHLIHLSELGIAERRDREFRAVVDAT